MTDTERLPEPLITNYEWQADAACRGMGLATFSTRPKNETPSDGIRQLASPSIWPRAVAIHCDAEPAPRRT